MLRGIISRALNLSVPLGVCHMTDFVVCNLLIVIVCYDVSKPTSGQLPLLYRQALVRFLGFMARPVRRCAGALIKFG